MSSNYHDYFIQGSRHLGRYEEMYQNCSDPWHIEELGLRLDMKAALLLLNGKGHKINNFLDIGAGQGLFTKFLTETIFAENTQAQGVITDISRTAIGQAEARLADPRLKFDTLDIRSLSNNNFSNNNRNQGRNNAFENGFDNGFVNGFDLVVMAQVLWGILDALGQSLSAIANALAPEGMLLISQHFPGKSRQKYGAEIVSSPDDLIKSLEGAGFIILDSLETNRLTNHHWAALATLASS